MIPVREFVDARIQLYIGNHIGLMAVLTDAGYYQYYFRIGKGYTEYFELVARYTRWCKENYPNDYYTISGVFFFTSKDIAVFMKLSI
jgi:hypothetical protein